MDLNKVIMIGRLGQEPEIRTLPNGNLVCNLSIVTSTNWKNKDGEMQQKSEWHKIVTFDQSIITYCQNFLNVGDTIYIEGKISYRTIESSDSTSGKKLKLCEIHVGKYGGMIAIYKKKRQESDESGSFSDLDAESGTEDDGDAAPKKKRAGKKEEMTIPYDDI